MNIKKELQKIAEGKSANTSDIKKYVASYMLDELDEYEGTDKEKAQSWYEDLMGGGCQSGFIGSLIYYNDTHKFYDKYYDDIEAIREELEKSTGETLQIKGDLKNFFAWLGFEETARNIAMELELDF